MNKAVAFCYASSHRTKIVSTPISKSFERKKSVELTKVLGQLKKNHVCTRAKKNFRNGNNERIFS